MSKQTIGDEFDEMFVKPTMSEKKMVTEAKLSAITCGKKNVHKSSAKELTAPFIIKFRELIKQGSFRNR